MAVWFPLALVATQHSCVATKGAKKRHHTQRIDRPKKCSTFCEFYFRDELAHLFFHNGSLHMSLRIVKVGLKGVGICAGGGNERLLRNGGSIFRPF